MKDYLKEPIIFLGFGRCGSTIISEIIFQHCKLAWVSTYQQKFPSSTKINLVRNLFDNPIWSFRGQKNQLNKVPLFNKYIFKPGESYHFWNQITERDFGRSFFWGVKENEQKVSTIRNFFSYLVKYQNRERLAFKTTGPARLAYLHSIFPDAKFVYIKRKPLPNIRSLLRVGFYQDRKNMLWWKGENIYSIYEKKKVEKWKGNNPSYIAALQYYKVNEVYEKEKENLKLSNTIFEVFYEDFIKAPEKVIENILNFLNLDSNSRIKDYLNQNEIYNRNTKEDYYIAPGLDTKVLQIATNGVN